MESTGQKQNLELRTELTSYQLLTECRDPLMKEVVKKVGILANSRAVLITGENGTGKQLVAHALVEQGDRKDKPFITLDCTNLEQEAFKSELFGHERGAFTGALTQKLGLFELADSGTAFLDEIGEIPIELQARFLGVLQGEPFRRLGGNSPIKSSFRLVTATNRNLANMVQAGTFREDLYYRIEGASIAVPPLRERKEDIVRLANHFVDEFSGRQKSLEAGAEAAIQAHSWPGNVRELRNAIERSVLFANGKPTITAADLHINYLEPSRPIGPIDQYRPAQPGPVTGNLDKADVQRLMNILVKRIFEAPAEEIMAAGGLMSLFEKLTIQSILEMNIGNKVRAAKQLGIGRQTLYNKILRYKIPMDRYM